MLRTLVDPDPRTEGETARVRGLQWAADRARAVVGLKAALERKYSPDHPRTIMAAGPRAVGVDASSARFK